MPFLDLVTKAHTAYKANFKKNEMELCALLSVKTGTCPEDCAYCPQSAHYKTGVAKEKLLPLAEVVKQARLAKDNGATRFCLGAAWRSPTKKGMPKIVEYIKAIKDLGLESCVTLGMLNDQQAAELKTAGLDYYNHNLDTSPRYYKKIITTRSYQDRLDTLEAVRKADINVCCGGIIGMGETREDRVEFLRQLNELPEPPKSLPINRLLATLGTPLAATPQIENFEFIRTLAVARIMFPQTMLRLAAGRETMSEEMQAWCFMAGANSIFYGDKLLTLGNPECNDDQQLLQKLGISTKQQAA
jgi:biotin synthase